MVEVSPKETVYDRVKRVVVDRLGVEQADVTDDASFVDNLNADSLGLVELIMALEEEFSSDGMQVSIPDDDADKITTLAQAVAYIEEHDIVKA